MDLQSQELPKIFVDHVEKRRKSVEGDALERLRNSAWLAFNSLGLPHKKTEAFKSLRLKYLFEIEAESHIEEVSASDIEPYKLKECQGRVVVLLDGVFRPDLSDLSDLPEGVRVMGLFEANQSFATFLSNRYLQLCQAEKDSFVLMNLALGDEGAFIFAKPKAHSKQPIQILTLSTSKNSTPIYPKVHLYLSSQSDLRFAHTHHIFGANTKITYTNELVDIVLDEGARAEWTYSHLEEIKGIHLFAMRSQIKRNGHLKVLGFKEGAKTQRHDFWVQLLGEESSVDLESIGIIDQNNQAHDHVLVEHLAERTESRQLFKNVVNDASKCSFQGKIYVHSAAQKTEAYQLNANMVLSDTATAISKPNLEIFADDVKASHGATTGQVDDEHIFYLKSRGIDEAVGTKMLIEGFINEIIDRTSIESLKEKMRAQVVRYFKR